MRYYNENPQVTYWKELAIKSQKAAMESQEIAIEALDERDFWRNDSLESSKRIETAFERFNSLPWYKKMFYKFDV